VIQLNGSSWWLVPNALLFFQAGLNPNTSHTISISNAGTGNMNLALNSMTVYGQDPPAAHKHVSAGAIAGAVVGSLAVASLLVFLGYWIWRKLRWGQLQPAKATHMAERDLDGGGGMYETYRIEPFAPGPPNTDSSEAQRTPLSKGFAHSRDGSRPFTGRSRSSESDLLPQSITSHSTSNLNQDPRNNNTEQLMRNVVSSQGIPPLPNAPEGSVWALVPSNIYRTTPSGAGEDFLPPPPRYEEERSSGAGAPC